MRVLDLFSGIGGMSLGLRMAGGYETVGFCEIEPFCLRVLAKHWPGVPIWEDIRELGPNDVVERVGRPDIIVAGFPCQDISAAGKGGGIHASRSGLVWDAIRLIHCLGPRWLLLENVPALRTRGADEVLESLEAFGYACWPLLVGADDVGAPHRRKRVWIVAYAGCERRGASRVGREIHERLESEQASGAVLADALHDGRGCCCSAHDDHGQQPPRHEPDGRDAGMADASGEGSPELLRIAGDARAELEAAVGNRWPARPGEPQHDWEAPRLIESGVGIAAHGLPGRLARLASRRRREQLKALGNAVVPQVVCAIGRAIREAAMAMEVKHGAR